MVDKAGQAHVRLRVAQLAAQLMADNGIRDYAFAKRKAARQLGIESRCGLPSNEEIDAALVEYRNLFEPEARERELEVLRWQALGVMKVLARFEPILTGGAVTGAVSPHSDIEIELYADSSKEFEQFLLNENIAFKVDERPGFSTFLLFAEPVDVIARVLPLQARHQRRDAREDSRRRLTVTQLARLIENSSEQTQQPGNDG
jgi:hypothetical protein